MNAKKLLAIAAGGLLVFQDLSVVASAATLKTLQAIEVGQDQVTLKTDQPVQYRAFLTQQPARLVVDLFDTQFEAESGPVKGEGAYLQRVRSGQYRSRPQKISRVVLELGKLASYQVVNVADGLRVMLGAEAAAAAKAATGETAKAGEPVQLFRDAPAGDTAAPPSSTETSMLQGGKAAEEVQTETKLGGAVPVVQGEKRITHRDIMQTLPKDRINLDFDATDIRDILKLLGVRAGINIIYGSDVSGSLSLHLRQVPFDEAFRTALEMSGLTTAQVGDNILRILTPDVLKVERGKATPVTRVFHLAYVKAEDIKAQVDSVRAAEGRTGQTVVSKNTNALVVTDTVEGLQEVEQLVSQLDQKPKQVLIEAKLIEVQLSKTLDLGIQWDYQQTAKFSGSKDTWFTGTQDPTITSPVAPTGALTNGAPTILSGIGASGRGTGVFLPADKIFGALTLGRINSQSFLAATLTAAASQGKAKVLSDPKVATLNNQQAQINITTQIPYTTANVSPTGTTVQSVSYVTVGITLVVVPTVNADGRVTLNVQPTVSQPSATAASAGTTGAPAVDTRTASTTVLVRDGETIVIGGLIQDSVSDVYTKVPFLGDIPILGWLFKKKTSSRTREELLVFVTPKIVAD